MTKNQSLTIHFAMEKETPGTIRYQEVDAKGNRATGPAVKVGTLYIKKTTLGSDVPARLQVQITAQ